MNSWEMWRNNLESKFEIHPLEIIQWEATRKCDLNCVHCGSPKEGAINKELDTAEIVNAFREIKRDVQPVDFKFVTITGGEPFLRKDLLQVLAEIKKLGWITTIQTNGNWLAKNSERITELIELNVRGIGLDLDGPEKVHDQFRQKEGHFQQTVALAKKLLKHNDILHTTITTVVTSSNFQCLNEMWDIISDLNPHRWRLLPIESVGRAEKNDLRLQPEQYRKLIEFVREKRIQNISQKHSVQIELGCIGWLGPKIEGWVRPYIWSCIAGRTCLGILYDGSLSACAHIDRGFVQGNVREKNIAQTWMRKYKIFREERPKPSLCAECDQANYCTLPMHKLCASGEMRDCAHLTYKKGGEKL